MTPTEKLESLDRTKQGAFLALFAGARLDVAAFTGVDGVEHTPFFGKAECEWVEDWRDFYGRELPGLGFTTFSESEPRPAIGAREGSVYRDIRIRITDEGWDAREAYWRRVDGS